MHKYSAKILQCANKECGKRFIRHASRQIFCCPTCKERASYIRNDRKTYMREWQRNNADKPYIKGYTTRWAQANPKRMRYLWRQSKTNRRARKAGTEGTHTRNQFYMKCYAYKWKCAYCNCALTKRTAQEDHVIPFDKGGSDYISNIVPSCGTCNKKKGNRLLCP
jgi:5-methylcytosine-specific restriction endonuclease McrA